MKRMAITVTCLLALGILITPRPTMSVTMSIVTVTAYHYCPGSKGITSSGKRVRPGILAISRDLERNLNMCFGDKVLLHGLGVYEFQDRMAPRWNRKVDIYLDSQQKARRFGVKRHIVLVKLV